MPGGVIDAVRRVNATQRPEDSVPLRALVLAAVMTSVGAVASQGALSITRTIIFCTVLPAAYWISYIRRGKDNWHIKLALAIGAVVALFGFFGQLGGIATLDEIRFPLADIFLWVQVLHSFDLPQRKDLHFSLGSSLALMGVAGSLAQSMSFAPFVVVYFLCAISALYYGHKSEVHDNAGSVLEATSGRSSPAAAWSDIARAAGMVVLVASVLFGVTPQPAGVRTFSLPFALGDGLGVAAGGSIVNPGFGSGQAGSRSSGAAYHGFNDRMDLRVRGDLSDDIVMRVRASAPAMLRGLIFDTYDGVAWSQPSSDPAPLDGGPPYGYPGAFRDLGPESSSARLSISRPSSPTFSSPGPIPTRSTTTAASGSTPMGACAPEEPSPTEPFTAWLRAGVGRPPASCAAPKARPRLKGWSAISPSPRSFPRAWPGSLAASLQAKTRSMTKSKRSRPIWQRTIVTPPSRRCPLRAGTPWITFSSTPMSASASSSHPRPPSCFGRSMSPPGW